MSTILVVDDRPESRYVTRRMLSGAGYDVREAETGYAALELAWTADLIVLDVVLPDIDGFEVCRRLKANTSTAKIPVLHKTAVYRDREHQRQGLAVGADAYLIEPVDPMVLIRTIRDLLTTAD